MPSFRHSASSRQPVGRAKLSISAPAHPIFRTTFMHTIGTPLSPSATRIMLLGAGLWMGTGIFVMKKMISFKF